MLPQVILHYIMLHFITIHYVTLFYVTLHYVTLLYIKLQQQHQQLVTTSSYNSNRFLIQQIHTCFLQYQIFFCVEDSEDAELIKIVNDLIVKYPAIDAQLFIGKPVTNILRALVLAVVDIMFESL